MRFVINSVYDFNKYGKNDDNLVDMIIDIEVTEEMYEELRKDELIDEELIKEEYPEDLWDLWISQNDYDRKENSVGLYLCNESTEYPIKFTDEEIKHIYEYLKENDFLNCDGLVINENTKFLHSLQKINRYVV